MVSYWLKYCPYAVETHDWEILAKTHNGEGSTSKRSDAAETAVYPLITCLELSNRRCPLLPSYPLAMKSAGVNFSYLSVAYLVSD